MTRTIVGTALVLLLLALIVGVCEANIVESLDSPIPPPPTATPPDSPIDPPGIPVPTGPWPMPPTRLPPTPTSTAIVPVATDTPIQPTGQGKQAPATKTPLPPVYLPESGEGPDEGGEPASAFVLFVGALAFGVVVLCAWASGRDPSW